MLDLFADTAPDEPPTLEALILAGNLIASLRYLEAMKFDDAFRLSLDLGFWVSGSRKDKATFYEHMGAQLRTACAACALPDSSPFTFPAI